MATSMTSMNCLSDTRESTKHTQLKWNRSLDRRDVHRRILHVCHPLIKKQGVHSSIRMNTAGFHYTGNGDTVHCNACALEVSNWTSTMEPFATHMELNSSCPFVCSLLLTKRAPEVSPINFTSLNSTFDNEKRSSKRHKIEVIPDIGTRATFTEVESLREVRKRTFSHWPHRISPSSTQMIEAGFFLCNVGDRVICLYCNLICQQWTPRTDDPCEVHKTLSPKCPYVITKLRQSPISSIPIVNVPPTGNNAVHHSAIACEQIVSAATCHTTYREIPKRYASFDTWSNENSPAVDNLVRAGFFYTGTKTIVTCFYCGGSLQNWTAMDNPTIEHARWFPHCAFAKQLCGDEQYRQIQESNQRLKEMQAKKQSDKGLETDINRSGDPQLGISNESTLMRYVAARLDLLISQKMLDRKFTLSVVKRCWEDQLRLKGNDFVSDIDLFVACTILQKQIEWINGNKENIIVPSIAMKKIREKELTILDPTFVNALNNTKVETSDETTKKGSSDYVQQTTDIKSGNATTLRQTSESSSSLLNPCALCLSEEKCLAFVPCGHVAACVSCGHSVRSCPICRTEIKAFVRVYL